MRPYSQNQEENIRDAALVGEWVESGLLDGEQGARLSSEIKVDLRQIHGVLRALLFLFTAVVIVAGTALVGTLLDFRTESAFALLLLVAAVACFGAALTIAREGAVYRCGVEEAFALASVGLLAGSAGIGMSEAGFAANALIIGMITACLASFAVYYVFRFNYAVLIGMALAALAPFALDDTPATKRMLCAGILLIAYIITRDRAETRRGQISGGVFSVAQGAAWAGLYLAFNVQFGPTPGAGWFYWWSYIMIWLLPAVGLWIGIRNRHRTMIDMNLLAALVTLSTNKRYLGWQTETWDPMLLGIFLAATAILLRRWLAKGPHGERHGFTPLRLLNSDKRLMAAASAAALAGHPHTGQAASTPAEFEEGGGRSGGAGASGNF